MLSWWTYFTPKLFIFSCIQFLVCFRAISPNLLEEFSFVVLECPLLSFVLFVYIFLIFLLSPIPFGLFPQVLSLFFLCCSLFFVPTCSSVLSFLPVFVALSMFPVEFPIQVPIFCSCYLIEPRFCHKLISFLYSSFNTVIFFVDIYVNTSFIFSVFVLTVLQSMFLSNDKVVFFSSIILFKFSKFIFCSSVNVCNVLFGCVVFLFSEVGG